MLSTAYITQHEWHINEWVLRTGEMFLENNPSQLPLQYKFHISWIYITVGIICALFSVPVVSEFDRLWPDILNKDTKLHSLQ